MTADHHMGGRALQDEDCEHNMVEEEQVPSQHEQASSDRVITVKSVEGPNELNFKIDAQGTKIGRHSTNQIVIFDESVSRYHAEIVCSGGSFYLYDIGSTTGTFLKVIEPLELQVGMIIEVGSYQLQTASVNICNESLKDSYVEFIVYESPEEMPDQPFVLHNNSAIGRKTNNTLSFTDDLHMSNLHCKIYLIQDKFFLEDIASTNGTWLRLSREGSKSEPALLNNDTIFKIGNSAMYQVEDSFVVNPQLLNVEDQQKTDGVHGNTACTICWESERDCVILPCRHNVTCMKCVKSVKACPVCRTHIDDLYRIFKC